MMRKLLIMLLMLAAAQLLNAKDYKFLISNYNDATEIISATELTYVGTNVKVTYSWGYVWSMTTDTRVNCPTKRLELDKEGVIWFIDNAGKQVAGVFSTDSGSEGFIAFLGEDGVMKATKPTDVDADFVKNYQDLRKQTGNSVSGPSQSKQPTQSKTTVTSREAPMNYWFDHPFGVTPKWGTNSQDFVNTAKSQYGLDAKGGFLGNLEAQIHWPDYDQMTFLGNPIEYLTATGNNEAYDEYDPLANMGINYIIDRKDEQKAMTDLDRYMAENGWEKFTKGSLTYYCKGNTLVEAGTSYTNKDRNKAVVCVTSKIYASKSAFEKAKAKL